MARLDARARAFINRFQGGFPVVDRPFSSVAAEIGIGESALIRLVSRLVRTGCLSRFGPLYDATAMGGEVVLAAMAVPAERFDAVAALLDTLPEVAHNYERDHHFNMWFVVAAETRDGVRQALDRIGHETGLEVLAFPKEREFRLGLWLRLDDNGAVDAVPVPEHLRPHPRPPAYRPDDTDRRLIAATQAGLPLLPRPWQDLAHRLDLDEAEVMTRFLRLMRSGIVRRIGAVPNHYRLGLRGNAMTVWDVPEERIEAAAACLSASPWVSHCYLRPRHGERWPYNLFAMVHGRDRVTAAERARRLARRPALEGLAHAVLFSTRLLKKTGLRRAAA